MNHLMTRATKTDLQLPGLTGGMTRQRTKVFDLTQSETSSIVSRQRRVVNHDAHRVQRPLEVRKSQSLPPPRRNGYLVTSEYHAPDRERGRYHGDDGQARKEEASHSRQLSLPSRNTKAETRRDKARSAPSHQDAPPQGVPAPKVNNFMSGASLYAGDSSQMSKGFAGVPTRHQDESHLKSHKFASSWAQVRAENHIEVTASNERGNDPVTEAVKTHDTTKHSQRKTEKSTSPFHARPREEPERSRASKPHPGKAIQSRDGQVTKSHPAHLFHARSREEENEQSPEPTAAQHPTSRLSTKSGQSKSEKVEQTSKFVTPTEVDGIKDEFRDTEIKENEVEGRRPRANGAERMPGKRRPAWNDRLVLNPNSVQPTRGSWRRYEAELTYKPTTTSTQHIQKAYLAPPKTTTLDTLDDVDKISPRQLPTASEPTTGDEEGMTSEGNPGDKEYILSRAEARMFLQMQETYGSDAFLTARKKRFFKTLLEVQKQEEKRQVEEQRRRKKKMEESKKRQHRQLLYVRRKFRAAQAHRFRTQYVTLRVFERKRGDRLMYGLPVDSDDETFDETDIADQEADRKEKSNIAQDKNNSRLQNGSGRQTATTKNMTDKHDPISAADSDENNPKLQSPQRKVTFSPDKGTDYNQSRSGNPLDSHTSGESVKHSEKTDISGNDSLKTVLVKPDPKLAGDENKETSVKIEESGFNNKSATTAYEPGSPEQKKQNQKEVSPTGDTTGKSGNNPSKGDNSVGHKQVQEHQPRQTNDSRAKALDGKKTVAKTLSTTAATESKERLNMVDSRQVNKQTEKGFDNGVASSGANPRAGNTGQSTRVKAGSKEQLNNANSGKDKAKSDKASTADVSKSGSNPGKSDSSVGEKKIGEQHSPQQNLQHKNDAHTAVPLTVSNPSNSNKSRDMASSRKGQVTSDSNQEKNPNLRSTATKEVPTKILVPTSNTGQVPTKTADTSDRIIAASPKTSSKAGADGHQKENIPVRKDSTVARTDTTNAADGQFLTTRASSVKNGGVGKDPKANGDNIKTTSSATTVNRKQKRKLPRKHAQSDEEKKTQLEKQYQHMFGASSDKHRLVVPKMEGIDTVIIKEMDKEGRTRTKKKDVKDVVREAKELANTTSGSDPLDRLATTTGQTGQTTDTLRPASADTLDFDDDDDSDEDDEDLFELVRRKYNLQIDSDDDDENVKR